MFRYGDMTGALFQVEHRHSDGTWSRLEPVTHDPHDQAGADPEREWDRGHVFVCTRCQETVRIVAPAAAGEDLPQAG
jgi:hypothetical protein